MGMIDFKICPVCTREDLRIGRSGRIFGTRLFTVAKNVGQLKVNEQVANQCEQVQMVQYPIRSYG